jgi:hypothetical protein
MTISVFVLLGRIICRSFCRVRIFTLLLIVTVLYTLYKMMYVQYVQGLCQSRLCEADYALSYLTYAMTTASRLNGRRPDRRQV